jgi:hypothetical protein
VTPFLFDRLYGKLGAKYFGLYVVFEVVSASGVVGVSNGTGYVGY